MEKDNRRTTMGIFKRKSVVEESVRIDVEEEKMLDLEKNSIEKKNVM